MNEIINKGIIALKVNQTIEFVKSMDVTNTAGLSTISEDFDDASGTLRRIYKNVCDVLEVIANTDEVGNRLMKKRTHKIRLATNIVETSSTSHTITASVFVTRTH